MSTIPRRFAPAVCCVAGFCFAPPLHAQLLTNLQSFPDRIAVGDPLTTAISSSEGPKGIATADFNGDNKPDLAAGNLDGTITVLFGTGAGRFAPPLHLRTGADELRSVLAADLNGDGKPDLAAASPMDGKLLVYLNAGGGNFPAATALPGWMGVRCLASGDFDGDGIADLAAAGPGMGVRHFRGTGGGNFEVMGDLARLSPLSAEVPRPVYAMRTLRSRDGLRDDLLVTHAESAALWILSTVPADRRNEPPANPATLPGWKTAASPVLLHEVQVHNATTLRDADGTAQPWVELINKSGAPVNLEGWKLKADALEWTFPPVTVAPGRFLTVFLSGKNRTAGAELHTSFALQQNSIALSLLLPPGTTANSFLLTEHSVPDVSLGLAPDANTVKWFDIPSPGAENNAGLSSLADITQDAQATLTITPRQPAAGQPVTVRVTMPGQFTGTSAVRQVWFSARPGANEVHHLMHRTAPGVFEEVLPSGAFTGSTPHRVLARLRDGASNDYTAEVHRGLDETQTVATVPRSGRLLPVASVPSPKVKAFEIGPVRTRATDPGAPADLVYADDVCGLLRVHRAGPGARRFEPMAIQDVAVRGAPRDVKLADTDGDGWLEATVVQRLLDLAVSFKNEEGVLRSAGELPTGRSPREAVMADFTGDGKPDAAVINRYSADISILPTSSTLPGLVSTDQIYSVNGEVAGLNVDDYNGDGRDDVMQLHRTAGEISIRYAGPDGTLAAPVFRPVSTAPSGGEAPSGVATADVNHDSLPDMVTANLGWQNGGSVSVLLGKVDGGFESPRTFSSGSTTSGGVFAISLADFNNDGHKDIVAGLFDCRVSFLFGDGAGNFTAAYNVTFAYESRVMVTGDFDQDGDTDVAGAGNAGDMVTLENRGAATAASWLKRVYAAPGGRAYGTYRIGLSYLNADTDPDLMLGTGSGVVIYKGAPGMTFTHTLEFDSADPSFSVSDFLSTDLDGDGKLEMVASCRDAACINILTRTPEGRFALSTRADVPSGRYLASGDLDGDGKPDLIGTGDVLWTALSSRPPQTAAAGTGDTGRAQTSDIVINEVLSQNTGVPISADNNLKTDFMEIFNGSANAIPLTGWKVRLESTQAGVPLDQTWTLPATSNLTAPARGRALILFSAATNWAHTGFTLPAEGGTVTLLRPDNTVADRVVYPRASENVSWSRFLDGHPSFHVDRIPSPGMSNLDNGTVPPDVQLTPPSPATLLTGQPIKFTARGRDDAGIISLSLLWNRLDDPLPEPQRLVLYDDGMHDDAAGVDGLFAGTLAPGLPAGAEVQFYLEAVDLSGETLLLPDNARLSAPGEPPAAWSFSLTTPPALQIVEAVANNVTLLRDELGDHPDFVIVRNTGTVPVDMSLILLTKSPLSDNSGTYAFPPGLTLAPGAEITVFADNNSTQGPLHAPFTLDSGGDDLSLLALTPSGARQWIHSLTVPATAADARYINLPGSDHFILATAAATNFISWAGTAWDANGNAFATVRFPTIAGASYRIEGDLPGTPVAWTLLETITGDGTTQTLTRPLAEIAALRATTASMPPLITVDAVLPSANSARISGSSQGLTLLALYYGLTDGGSTPAAWTSSTFLPSSLVAPAAFSPAPGTLAPDTLYHYRLAGTTSGGTSIWSAPGTTFRTLPVNAGFATLMSAQQAGVFHATINIGLNSQAPPDSSVELLAGTTDAFANLNAWQHRVPAVWNSTASSWTATLTGLTPGRTYIARALVSTAADDNVSAVSASFFTKSNQSNLLAGLFLTEIMYHPQPPTASEAAAGFEDDDFEFIELQNLSGDSMDLSGLWFEGLDFDFPPAGAPVIPAGGYAVIASNPHAFAMRYGTQIPLAGWTLHPFRNSSLANSGETLTLHAADSTTLFSARYKDRPDITDGGGFSLEYRGPTTGLYLEQWEDYKASRLSGGTPGRAGLALANQSFIQWQPLHFNAAQINDSAVSGGNADPDRDGLPNFIEYACGTPPFIPNSRELLSISHGTVDGQRAVLLTFPVNPAAREGIFTIQGKDHTFPAWMDDALNITGNITGFPTSALYGYGWGVSVDGATNQYTSSNFPYSAVLSGDGKQLLTTIAVVPGTGWLYQPSPEFRVPSSRLFRLRVSGAGN